MKRLKQHLRVVFFTQLKVLFGSSCTSKCWKNVKML